MQTKFRIVETEDYILAVSDDKPKLNRYCTSEKNIIDVGKIHNPCTIFKPSTKKHLDMLRSCNNIVAHKPKNNAPELTLPLLPENFNGDVEELALKCITEISKKQFLSLPTLADIGDGFVLGYKAATKKYNEALDAMQEFVDRVDKGEVRSRKTYAKFKIILESLKQPTPTWFVAETDYLAWKNVDDDEPLKNKLKTTTIGGKEYLVGTYLYE